MRRIGAHEPNWQAPSGVRALTTFRCGGVSQGIWTSLNLATHVGDNVVDVASNRDRVQETFLLPSTPYWLDQVHGTDVLTVTTQQTGLNSPDSPPVADAAVTTLPGCVLAVLTADCLPIFLAQKSQGGSVGVVHAGWRGLAGGVVEHAVAAMRSAGKSESDPMVAAFGPAISRESFEVGDEVREALCRPGTEDRRAFTPADRPGKWTADLYELARYRLVALGVNVAPTPNLCTVQQPGEWFSYRANGETGRMASLIWQD